MSSKRNLNILADQQHTLPPYHPVGYSSAAPVLSPVTASTTNQQHPPPPQILPGVSSLSNPRYNPHPPPPLLHTSSSQSHPESQEKLDHAYSGPHSGHATPIIRNPQEVTYQRTSSTPVPPQGQAPPPLERPPMENGHSSQALYAPHTQPPHPEQHHMMYPPQHPVPPMIDHGPYAHPAYHAQGYLYPNMHMSNQNARKKSMRASQACDKCRERKSKCDEQRPCSTCKEQNIECHYKDSQPSKIDKSNAQLAETMQLMVDQLKVITERIGSLEERMGPTEKIKIEGMSRQNSRMDTPTHPVDTEQKVIHPTIDPRNQGGDKNYDFAEHTTAAHKLLSRWPSIHRLFPSNKMQDKIFDNYPLKVEDRGGLRLYGRGEQKSHQESVAIGAASPAHSMGSDDFGGAPSPELLNNVFSQDEPKRSDPILSSRLEMDSVTLHRLYDKYKRHIHRLHPFLDIDNFGKYIRWFINTYCADSNKYPLSPHNMFVNGPSDSQRAGMKRKRSELGAASYSNPESGSRRRVPERTVINAIVYLVFALGKVCEAVKVPGPLGEPLEKSGNTSDQTQAGASPANVKPSPSSPHSGTIGQTPPTVGDGFRADSRGSSFEDSPSMSKKFTTNCDVIPGLDYYREAVSILGDFADANDLPSAQARLLAALYKGQLSRVQESYSWLHLASRTCQYRIRLEGLNRSQDPQKLVNKTKNLTLLAFWTCLQLESDILAELDYPHSGLSAMEGTVSWPNNVLDEEASRKIVSESATDLDMINIYYSAQLFLRKHLNQIHTRLYSVDLAKQDPKTLSDNLYDLDSTLQGWRDLPHPITFWNDEQLPHPDILAARLRAKYYGARYVTTRPFLDYALHVMEDVEKGRNLEEITRNAQGEIRHQELALFKAIKMMDTETVKQKVRICIDSALKSTVALDFVNDHRLIVTNIMGTAHAQFGNILVLAATHTSSVPWVRELVTREALGHYLERTIQFLHKIRESSKTACVDMAILKDLQVNMGLNSDMYCSGATYIHME